MHGHTEISMWSLAEEHAAADVRFTKYVECDYSALHAMQLGTGTI